MRKNFPGKVKVQAFHRAKGHCEKCGAKLAIGNINFDHINPDGLTGEPTLGNCCVMCRACHSIKTRQDVADIAKAKRRERAHVGARTSRNLMPGSKASAWKKTFNHGWVRRDGD